MKRTGLKILCALMAVVAVMSLTACGTAKEKMFSKAGMTITLTDAFTEKSIASLTCYYESRTEIVTVLKEEFSNFNGNDYTLGEYTDLVISNNNLHKTAETSENGYMYFSYERTVSGKEFYYYATTFKGTDAYWLIQFACEKSNESKSQANFDKYASSVVFD